MGNIKQIVFKKLLLFILFLFSTTIFAQSKISGTVTNSSSNETLPGASVILNDLDGNLITYGITDENGIYTLEVESAGEYTIEVNFLGFQKDKFKLTALKNKATIQNFSLDESHEILEEIIIQGEAPIKLSGDTLSYDAKKLATGHEVVVEDLIKNIPGITVQKDGKIYYGDTQIEKILIEGDDLFNKGYSLLTRNMPTKPLDRIEILRNYSNNKLLKGIENTSGVALNLTIDENFKNIWFGDVSLAIGNDSRYNNGANLMNFSKFYKNFATCNFNNAGYDKVGAINDMIYNSSDIETVGQGDIYPLMNMSFNVPFLDAGLSRFNNVKMASISSIMPLTKKIKLTLKGFIGFDKLKNWNTFKSVVDVPDTYFENTQSNSAINHINKAYVNAYIVYDISPTQMLQSSTTINAGDNDFVNNLNFNGTNTQENLLTQSSYFDQRTTYTHQWKKRNAVLVKTRFLEDRLPQQYSIDDYLMGDLFSYDIINAISNDIKNKKRYGAIEADFKLKQKNEDLISFKIGYNSTVENISTVFNLFTDSENFQPEDFQAESRSDIGNLYAGTDYTWKNDKLSITANLSAHQLFNRFVSREGTTKKQNPFYVSPNLFLNYRFNGQNTLSATYSYNFTNTSLAQVNDTYLLTSSRSFAAGLGYFDQLQSSLVRIIYTTKHYLDRYNFSFDIDYSKQNNALSFKSQLDQNSSLFQSFIMRGGDRLGIGFNSHFVVKKLSGSVKLAAKTNKMTYFNIINDLGLRKNTSYNQLCMLTWRSDFKGCFDFNLGTEWSFNETRSEITFKNNTKISSLDLLFKSGNNLFLKLGVQHYNFEGIESKYNYFFSDFESFYTFKDQKYIVGIDARNLFNTKNFVSYNISDYGYTSSSYRLLPRYVLLSFKIRF